MTPASRTEARLLATVGTLALAAVIGVALAARLGARRELRQFAELERIGALDDGLRVLRDVAVRNPAGITPETLRRTLPLLPAGATVLLVAADGTLAASASDPARPVPGLATRRAGDELRVTGHDGDRAETFELRLRGGSVPARLADGSSGELLLVVLPSARQGRHAAAVLGSLDRWLVGATAACGALAVLVLWLLARRVLAAAELQRQHELRRDLANDVAHELRTPLTAMLCRLESVKDGLVTDAAGTLEGLHADVTHLSRLVDDLQELALAEAGQLRLVIATTPLAPVARSAARAAGLEADPRLRLELDDADAVRADPARLRQVITNLLTNAARHTPASGTIRVSARRDGSEVRIEVADTGSGLDAAQLPLVFERFYRTDPARRRATGGSGLGLAIVKSLVEAQGGRVWARGRPGEGAVLGFSLPPATPDAGPA